MATKIHYFSGKAKWAKVYQGDGDDKYENWKIDLFMDPPSWEEFKKSGIQLQQKFSEEGSYVTFRRDYSKIIKGELVKFDPPAVVNMDNEPITDKIGNGSTVIVKVLTFDTRKGTGTRMEAVKVVELVKYDKAPLVVGDLEVAPF